MTKLLNGCSYTELWVSPADWKTTTAKTSLLKEWYVQCYFFDPLFKDKYPKGKPYRKKLNKLKTLDDRKAGVKLLLEEIPNLFEVDGYNHITGQFMIEKPLAVEAEVFGPHMPFIPALRYAFTNLNIASSTTADIRNIINKLEPHVAKLRFNTLPVSEFRRKHIKMILATVEKADGAFSGHKFNKYRSYLQILFTELLDWDIVESNIITDIKKRKVLKNVREVLTIEERTKIYTHLKNNYPTFLDFTIIFFHSGGRIAELLRLEADHVNLARKRYKTLIRKGGVYEWEYRPIKTIALPYWINLLQAAKKGDFVFSEGLRPGAKMIRREQISRRWNVHVKKKLDISADFYSMKHSNLDEIAESLTLEDAARAAGHKSTAMVKTVYAVGEKDRNMKRLQNMKNEFAPGIINA